MKRQKTTVRKTKDSLSPDEQLQIIHDYMTTDLSNSEIAEKYNTSQKNVEVIVTRHWKALTNVRETKALVNGQMSNMSHKDGNYMALKQIGRASSINQDFLDLLSSPDDPELTDQELQYCFHYVATGDNYTALQESGLHIGLMGNAGEKKRHEFQLSCRLRGFFLRKKPNVAEQIARLKADQWMPQIIDKNFIQSELLEHLYHLKERNDDGACDSKIERTIELIGKSVGAFSDVVKIQEVDPAKALDYLDSLSQADASVVKNERELLENIEEDLEKT